MCVPKGKWYDCLRPTTNPYQGFGSMANFAHLSAEHSQGGAGENWTPEVYGKMK